MVTNEIEKDYTSDFNKVIDMIEFSREKVYRKVNEELINLYWNIGCYVSEKIKSKEWGSKVVDNLVVFIKSKYPTLKGFDRSGIYRMKQFYELYKDDEIVAPLARQLSWTNNLLIMSKTKSKEEREFYIKMALKNNYTKAELSRQLVSAYYERYMIANKNKAMNFLPSAMNNNYPNTGLLDTYSLEFLSLSDNYTEKDLKKSIISNLKNFILEV